LRGPPAHDSDVAPMPKDAESERASARLERTLELVYSVEGVVAARIWQWSDRVAVGVRGGMATSPAALIRHVEHAVAGLREPGEVWEFGILEDSSN
jgi:hypothetical protein